MLKSGSLVRSPETLDVVDRHTMLTFDTITQWSTRSKLAMYAPILSRVQAVTDCAVAGESDLLWQDPREKWLRLIDQHCSDVKNPYVLLQGDGDRPWRLLCSKVRSRWLQAS